MDTILSRGLRDTGGSKGTSNIFGSVAAGIVLFGFFHAVLGIASFSSRSGVGIGVLSMVTGCGGTSSSVVEGEGGVAPLITAAGGRGFSGIPGERAGSPISFPGWIPSGRPSPWR